MMQSPLNLLFKRKIISLCFLFSSFCYASTAFAENVETKNTNQFAAQVELIFNAKSSQHPSLAYETSVRIHQVIADAVNLEKARNTNKLLHLSDRIYWPAATLYHQSSSKIDAKLANITKALYAIEQNQNPETAKALANLTKFIEKSTFKERIDLPVELDYFLSIPKINPAITGSYSLHLPQKPFYVWVVGAVKEPSYLPFKALNMPNDYFKKAQPLSTLGLSDVWVISPNAKARKQGISYWNKEETLVLPGSIIYVPFKELSKQLNDAIAELLQSRVLSI